MLPAEHRFRPARKRTSQSFLSVHTERSDVFRQGCVEKALFQGESNHTPSPELLESLAGADRDEKEAVVAVESTLKHYRVPSRRRVRLRAGCLRESTRGRVFAKGPRVLLVAMARHHAGGQWPASRLGIVLTLR